jgi:heme exporter protein CcmD
VTVLFFASAALRFRVRQRAMDNAIFITLAYAITGLAIGGLILATWARARAVARQLQRHDAA